MIKKDNQIHLIFLFLLGCRLVFIFSDAMTAGVEKISMPTKMEKEDTLIHAMTSPEIVSGTISDEQPESTDELMKNIQNKIQLTEDIEILETAYKKEKDPKIAKTLIEKLAQNYEFEKANAYLQELIMDPGYDGDGIDPNLHLYIAMQDPTIVSITDAQSIKKLIPIMDGYKNAGRINAEDYDFYEWLIKLRNKYYKWAREIFNRISSPRYKEVIQSVTQAISVYDSAKAIPRYYQDALVGLSLLKNGYFSIAKKLALETALENNKYILPYQILAYTHFLTNNRETANEYFLKLADVDISNKDVYRFLIGISFYRSKEYDQAILYLSQVDTDDIQTDTYRYLILGYKALEDTQNMVQTRQKLLGQKDITGSDYYDYFYQTFYKPYSKGEKPAIYEQNKTLAEMYVTDCATRFTGTAKDVCDYGRIGLAMTKTSMVPDTEFTNLIQLANTYHEPYLFRMIGDGYLQQGNVQEAKKNYVKALSLSTENDEQDIIKNKISQIDG